MDLHYSVCSTMLVAMELEKHMSDDLINTLEARKTELYSKMRQMEHDYQQLIGEVRGIDSAILAIRSASPQSAMPSDSTNSPTVKGLNPQRRFRLSDNKRKIYQCLIESGKPLEASEVADLTKLPVRYVQQTLIKAASKRGKDIIKDGSKYSLSESGIQFFRRFPSTPKQLTLATNNAGAA